MGNPPCCPHNSRKRTRRGACPGLDHGDRSQAECVYCSRKKPLRSGIAAMTADLPQRCALLLALLALPANGCSSKAEFAEVTGVVLLDGKPMPAALVEFL